MECEHMSLITELGRGKELTRQLKKNLHSSSHEECVLVEKILSCYAQALSMLNCVEENRHAISNMLHTPSRSFVNGSKTNKLAVEDCGQNVSVKKRKKSASGKGQVKVCTRTVVEGLDDGYRWRKYGQKEILGAKFRRGYYRCTHRKQGCLATKQVQKSDANPTMLEVTYQGSHTCNKLTNFNIGTPSTAKGFRKNEKRRQKPQIQETKKEQDGVSVTLFEGLQVETEDLNGRDNYEFPFFEFSSPANEEEKIFSDAVLGGNLMGDWSAMFMSPSSSASGGFSPSPFSVNDNGLTQILPIPSESDITEIVSTPTSVNNSPISHFNFSLDEGDLGTSLFVETPDFIC